MANMNERLEDPNIYVDMVKVAETNSGIYSDFEEQAFADPERQRYMIDRIKDALEMFKDSKRLNEKGEWVPEPERYRMMFTLMCHLIGNAEAATGDPVPNDYLYGAMEMMDMLTRSRRFLHADDGASMKTWDLAGLEK